MKTFHENRLIPDSFSGRMAEEAQHPEMFRNAEDATVNYDTKEYDADTGIFRTVTKTTEAKIIRGHLWARTSVEGLWFCAGRIRPEDV